MDSSRSMGDSGALDVATGSKSVWEADILPNATQLGYSLPPKQQETKGLLPGEVGGEVRGVPGLQKTQYYWGQDSSMQKKRI